MFRKAAVLTLLFVLANSLTVLAHDREEDSPAAVKAAPIATAIAGMAHDGDSPLTLWKLSQQPRRPAALTTLYGTYVTLQALDLVSTQKALAAGATERNPLMGSGGVGRMVAVKAATGALSIYFAEKAWKKNKVGAIVLMAVTNGMTAAIVARNTRNARR